MEEENNRTSQTTPAAVRREQWRESQQISIGSVDDSAFESDNKELELKPTDSLSRLDEELEQVPCRQPQPGEECDQFIFRSGQSSFSSPQLSSDSPQLGLSPQISVDSPRISFSPLQIRDSIEGDEFGCNHSQSLTVPENQIYQQPPSPRSTRGRPGAGHRSPLLRWPSPGNSLYPNSPYSPHSPRARSVSPISPAARVSPRSPIPGIYFRTRLLEEQESYRRCMSDTDLSTTWVQNPRSAGQDELIDGNYDNVFYSSIRYPPKTSSVESDQSSLQDQELPLDLSMRSSLSSTSTSESVTTKFLFPGRKAPRLSSSSQHSLSFELEQGTRRPFEQVGPVLEGRTSEQGFTCPLCNQMFGIHDRLAKHMASRHKSRSTDSSSKAYPCDVCKRSFARSDMLTRHMRLHTGIKPYTCRACGQVFSRSDHLSTHQRTHTGEKPYRCPSCPYSACRRDMITRHLRTHSRYEHQDSSSIEDTKPVLRSVSTESDSAGSTNLSEGRIGRDFTDTRYYWDTGDPGRELKMSETSSDRMSSGSDNLLSVNSDRYLSDLSDSSRLSDGENRLGFDRSPSSGQRSYVRSPLSCTPSDRSPGGNSFERSTGGHSFDRSPAGHSFDLQNSRVLRDFASSALEDQNTPESICAMSRDISEENVSGSTG